MNSDRNMQSDNQIYHNTSKKNTNRTYLAIDLKSFYASVECVERRLDPLTTNLVVADSSRTEKTICLAVSPSLKAYGIPGRARLFEVVQKVKEVNQQRLSQAIHKNTVFRENGNYHFSSSSFDTNALKEDPSLELSYIVAPPRMALYMEYSSRIFNIYLKYVSSEDIHVYSIDECFIDVTDYLSFYHMDAHELAMTMIRDVLFETGITATGGIGTNLYLCKIAMDIVAKHVKPDKDGVRLAELDEMSYRKLLWNHTPITDFWRIGRGYAKKLAAHGLYTMGDIALCSVGNSNDYYNEELLYRLFGVNAELLIDHAWGWEPVTIKQIKAYRPENNSISSGQVLSCPYTAEKAALIIREMTDLLVLDLVEKRLVTDQIVLTIGYDSSNLKGKQALRYKNAITTDHYGRSVPKHAHGSINLGCHTSGSSLIIDKTMELYDTIIDKNLSIRRLCVCANHVIPEQNAKEQGKLAGQPIYKQLNLFSDFNISTASSTASLEKKNDFIQSEKEKKMQRAVLDIKKKFGKNAILKGMNLEEGATARERNAQIGGHKA